jgi:hypothetical protein
MRGLAALLAIAVVASLSAPSDAKTKRPREQQGAPAPITVPADRRDRVVASPGSPFNGKTFWYSLASCGAIHFRLSTLYNEAAIQARVTKPDPAANASLTKKGDDSARIATRYFEAAEQFLVADRGITRDEAVLIYDPAANEVGDRLKSVDAAIQATKPCPTLYQACRGVFAKACQDQIAAAN